MRSLVAGWGGRLGPAAARPLLIASAASRCRVLAAWLTLWLVASSCASTRPSAKLSLVAGTASEGGHGANVVCAFARGGWCGNGMPRLDLSAAAECDTRGSLLLTISAPGEFEITKSVPLQLPQGSRVTFQSFCFPLPRAAHARLVVSLLATCDNDRPRDTVTCEMPR